MTPLVLRPSEGGNCESRILVTGFLKSDKDGLAADTSVLTRRRKAITKGAAIGRRRDAAGAGDADERFSRLDAGARFVGTSELSESPWWGGVRVQRAGHADVLGRMPSSESLSILGARRVFLGARVTETVKHCPTVPLASYEFPGLRRAGRLGIRSENATPGRDYLTEIIYQVVLQKSTPARMCQLILYYY